MNCFDECSGLRKLYLEHNRIYRLEGLHNCQNLEELFLGDQKIGNREFTFDEYSLAAISNTLVILDLPKVNLVHCKPLYFLENLITLNLNDNLIADFQEEMAPMLTTLIRLTTLTMLRNPVVKLTPKYRDQVVALTQG
jgi:Leucine-rich repeat (LRR) protein